MVSSEAVPFSKSGGLADVVTSLSQALVDLDNEVRLVLPCYGSTDDALFTTTPMRLTVAMQGGDETVGIKHFRFQGVDCYFIIHPWFTSRKGIYGDTSFTPYSDNFLRFLLLAKVPQLLCAALDWHPDILHCHDWTAGLVPFLAKRDTNGVFSQTKTIFTIHNLAYQGDFPRMDLLLGAIEVDPRILAGEGIHQRVNMLKAGLEFADIITTVSPTYAKEIQTVEHGCGLSELLQARSNHLYGILNGIDTQEWGPLTDPFIDMHFSTENLSGKRQVKSAIQKRFGLPIDPSVPVISMISRIAEQKGFVELCQGTPSALEQILTELPVQVLIIGTGDKAIEEKLTALGELHQNLSVNLIFSNTAAHLVEAGSDFFLMPSRYEPCGLNQMYSLRYGTVPIARRTGGLADSIVDCDDDPVGGTGILFSEMSGKAIFEAVARAVQHYAEGPQHMLPICIRGMEVDFSWRQSAQEYMRIFKGSKG
jgi:starch synthase